MNRTKYGFTFLVLSFVFILTSCDEEFVPEVFKPRTDHEAYLQALEKTDLLKTALGRDWLEADKRSLENPVVIQLPYQEAFYFSPQIPEANGYVFSVKRGQKIQINLDPDNSDSIKLFVDLFRVETNENHTKQHVASADSREFTLGFESREDARYHLRIQPELLRGGRFNLTIQAVPALYFPVQAKDKTAIGSFFGDPRDGGRRLHHGIDIFASRHTPILAPTDGFIRFAGERGLGGRVVWMRDRQRNMTLYFAHLETIFVEDNDWVEAGDTLGTVGNSGNARTTPPHLHFGIYQNGPVDPYFFVAGQPEAKRIRANRDHLGTKVRTLRKTELAVVNQDSTDIRISLDQYQLLEVRAVFEGSYRVELPGGLAGVIRMSDVESIDHPIRTSNPGKIVSLLEMPSNDVVVVDETEIEEELTVHGRDTTHWYVRTASGKNGWVEALAE